MSKSRDAPALGLAVEGHGFQSRAGHPTLMRDLPKNDAKEAATVVAAGKQRPPTRVTATTPSSRASGSHGNKPAMLKASAESETIVRRTTMVNTSYDAESTHVSPSSVPHRETDLELSLVRNLKKQIACLEAQVRVAQRQKDAIVRQHHNLSQDGPKLGLVRALAGAAGSLTPQNGDELPLLHAVHSKHVDVFMQDTLPERLGEDGHPCRLRTFPEAYQIERSALLHNVELLTRDIEGLQSIVSQLRCQHHQMAVDVANGRVALRESQAEADAAVAECAALQQLLQAERTLRNSADASPTLNRAPVPNDIAVADALSQRDYYQLQARRVAEQLARSKSREQSLSMALRKERESSKSLEVQLGATLDRVSLLECRESELAAYCQQLGGRFVTVSATLRHILDTLPEEQLRQHRVPSPERGSIITDADESYNPTVTIEELRNTVEVWHDEAAARVVMARRATETMLADDANAMESDAASTTMSSSDRNAVAADEDTNVAEGSTTRESPVAMEAPTHLEPQPPSSERSSPTLSSTRAELLSTSPPCPDDDAPKQEKATCETCGIVTEEGVSNAVVAPYTSMLSITPNLAMHLAPTSTNQTTESTLGVPTKNSFSTSAPLEMIGATTTAPTAAPVHQAKEEKKYSNPPAEAVVPPMAPNAETPAALPDSRCHLPPEATALPCATSSGPVPVSTTSVDVSPQRSSPAKTVAPPPPPPAVVPPPPPSSETPAPPLPPPAAPAGVPFPPSFPTGTALPPPPPPVASIPSRVPGTPPLPLSMGEQLVQLDARIDAQEAVLKAMVDRLAPQATAL